MPSKREFYVTRFEVEVLSEEPYLESDLAQIDKDITDGDCSGRVYNKGSERVDGPTMAKLLLAQRSDPDFFNLTETGEDTHAEE